MVRTDGRIVIRAGQPRQGRARDPEARRNDILRAAAALVAERGVGNVSHRAVAERAGVPLGSTTYYFPSLAELVSTALELTSTEASAEIAAWRPAVLGSQDLAATLAELIDDYLSRPDRALIEYELYLAGARDDRLRGHARRWLRALLDLLEEVADPATAKAMSAQIDGTSLQALVLGEPLDRGALETALRALGARIGRPA